jgi:catechol 2,3-dioxygenase-like lactoylglutathione lyase family enzyme
MPDGRHRKTEMILQQLRTLNLNGVDHTARPTWRLRETIEFYRDKMGLPLVHVVSARGWGPSTHPDFLHFFFDSGNGSTIAFFYYLGSDEPREMHGRDLTAPFPEDHVFDATHTAWTVESAEDLPAWKARLEAAGLTVSAETTHEVIESIYVRDPNGYFIEFTRKLRPLNKVDGLDGALTLTAALEAEDAASRRGQKLATVDDIWKFKAALLDIQFDRPAKGLSIYVPQLEEFSSLTRAAKIHPDCRVTALEGYDVIEADQPVEFRRKALGLKPAIWYGMFTGGVRGKVTAFDRDRVVVEPLNV